MMLVAHLVYGVLRGVRTELEKSGTGLPQRPADAHLAGAASSKQCSTPRASLEQNSKRVPTITIPRFPFSPSLSPTLPLASIPLAPLAPPNTRPGQMALLPKITSLVKSYAGQLGAADAAAACGASASCHGGSDETGRASSGSGGEGRTSASPAPPPAGSLHPRGMLSCLRVLCAVAGRAPWAAERVAREPGLVEAVAEVRAPARGVVVCAGGKRDDCNPRSQNSLLYEFPCWMPARGSDITAVGGRMNMVSAALTFFLSCRRVVVVAVLQGEEAMFFFLSLS